MSDDLSILRVLAGALESSISSAMPLAVGEQLGPYQIVSLLGQGGMGHVYRAHDSRLNRDVAIKISNARFTPRFDREAKAIAALSHPNICTVFDVGPNYLVMELVEGETLSSRLARGLLSLSESLDIARQVASALECAHDKSIVHRDLKPGNVMLRPDGVVKVLDFGLAKVASSPAGGSGAPGLDSLTGPGMIVGTPWYMSPEQAKGLEVDRRTDIWSFGVLLYELSTGRRPFAGEHTQELLSAVAGRSPASDIVPFQLRRLIARCLEKDPDKRLRNIGDAWFLVDEHADRLPAAGSAWLVPAVWTTAVILTAILGVAGWTMSRPMSPPQFALPSETRLVTQPPSEIRLSSSAPFEISPDGKSIAFTTDNSIAIWSLATHRATLLQGTEGGVRPFWSPDSQHVAFTNPKGMYRLPVAGGTPQPIITPPPRNKTAAWGIHGDIIFVNEDRGLSRISDSGGDVTVLTKIPAGTEHDELPVFLPDGRHFLFFRHSKSTDGNGIYAGDLNLKPEEQPTKAVRSAKDGPLYIQGRESGRGSLVFLQDDTLYSQEFDATNLVVRGMPTAFLKGVRSDTGTRLFSATNDGTLIARNDEVDGQLTWLDRGGKILSVVGRPRNFGEVSLAPDGRRVGYRSGDNLWQMDLAGGIPLQILTKTPKETLAGPPRDLVWSPNGAQVAYRYGRDGREIYRKRARGDGEPELLVGGPSLKWPTSWSKDGQLLLFTQSDNERGDVMGLPIRGSARGTSFEILATGHDEGFSSISPDGRWIAYISSESDSRQVYLRSFRPTWPVTLGEKIALSREPVALFTPIWRDDGAEIFFRNASNGAIMAVNVATKATAPPGEPFQLFVPQGDIWDVTGDGKRFLVAQETRLATVTIIQNWRPR